LSSVRPAGARQNLVGAVDRTILNGSSSLIVT
jgi:hypothetical protein